MSELEVSRLVDKVFFLLFFRPCGEEEEGEEEEGEGEEGGCGVVLMLVKGISEFPTFSSFCGGRISLF